MSDESSKGAPGGGKSAALILRLTPTLSPTSEPEGPGDGWTGKSRSDGYSRRYVG